MGPDVISSQPSVTANRLGASGDEQSERNAHLDLWYESNASYKTRNAPTGLPGIDPLGRLKIPLG